MLKPPLPQLTPLQEKLLKFDASLFKIDGRPGDEMLTPSQYIILYALIYRHPKRVQIICPTQYGKSLVVALACIIIACLQGVRVAVVAPTGEKAKIIMRYFIDHLGDNKLFYQQLNKDTKLDRLRQEESKNRIILKNGGGIFVVSTDERDTSRAVESAMGQGAEVVILDEGCLVSDNTEATIFRMIAGKGSKAFYCKIGNPFYTNVPYTHFKTSWESPNYYKIFVDYLVALAEGRYTKEYVEEAQGKPLWDVLGKCEFPPEDVQDDKGFRPLFLTENLQYGMTRDILKGIIEKDWETTGGNLKKPLKLGGDIGGGGDKNVFTVRYGNFACVVGENQSNDTMSNVGDVIAYMEEFHIKAEDVNLDDIGIGRGVVDRLKELGHEVNGVSAGSSAIFEPETFANIKAEMCWALKNWLSKPEVRLDQRNEWAQIGWLKYKVNSEKKIIMESKDDLKKRTKKSPDYAESLYLTFAEKPFSGFV